MKYIEMNQEPPNTLNKVIPRVASKELFAMNQDAPKIDALNITKFNHNSYGFLFILSMILTALIIYEKTPGQSPP